MAGPDLTVRMISPQFLDGKLKAWVHLSDGRVLVCDRIDVVGFSQKIGQLFAQYHEEYPENWK